MVFASLGSFQIQFRDAGALLIPLDVPESDVELMVLLIGTILPSRAMFFDIIVVSATKGKRNPACKNLSIVSWIPISWFGFDRESADTLS
jgi:hypothetical protein